MARAAGFGYYRAVSQQTLDLIATSTFGLEAVVARELQSLGYETTIGQNGRIAFAADAAGICRANLWLRCADRVLLQIGRFAAADFDQLFDTTKSLPWEQWIPADGAFPVNGRSVKSKLTSVPAVQRTVKKAIVERLLAAHGAGELPETGPRYTVEVALLDDVATLTLDTTGPGLNKRGYRPLAGVAPLKETLAAALILLSFWRPDRPLIDTFCGTGTIPIEAALIGRNIAPGSARAFAAEAWPQVPADLWQAARDEARAAARADLPIRIIGTDADAESLRLARRNAEAAGVADDVHFQEAPFAELSSSARNGCLICNPPYGKRLSDDEQVRALYLAMPDVFRRLKTWSFYVLSARPGFERLIGRKADRRRKLFNGRIECTYYQFHGPKPGGDADGPAQAFGGLTEKDREQAEVFRNRLVKMARHLRRWPKRGVTCYRLYDRDIPEVPLVVDRYEHLLHLAEYDRPHDRSPGRHSDWLDLMADTAADALGVGPADVFMKRRSRQRGLTQYQRQGEGARTFEVGEGGLKFIVNLSDYLDTGLFLDHRITRSMVRGEAAGKRLLNLFAYTGAFTVYAAAGGAASTVTVDRSNTYLDWAGRNMALNGFAGPAHRFVRADAMAFLADHKPGPAYDLAVVDPPTFSNTKGSDEFWDVQRDHAGLLDSLLRLMSPGGVIFFSTNFRRVKFAETDLAGATVREISRQTVPDDFRNKRIHRCWRIVRDPA